MHDCMFLFIMMLLLLLLTGTKPSYQDDTNHVEIFGISVGLHNTTAAARGMYKLCSVAVLHKLISLAHSLYILTDPES